LNEEVLERFKEGCKAFGGELYERKGKIICEPSDNIRIIVKTDTLETRVVDTYAGLQRWDTLRNVSLHEVFGEKHFSLEFDELDNYSMIRKDAIIYIAPPLEGIDEKLRRGVAKKFKPKYIMMTKRALRATLSRR